MVLVPLHATPTDQPPPLTPTRLLTEWTWEWSMALGIAIAGGALHCWAGRAPPPRRSLAGAAQLLVPARRAWVDCACHHVGAGHLRHGAVQRPHGAAHDLDDGGSDVPRAGGAGHPRVADPAALDRARMLLAVLHSRLARVLTFAPLTLALFIATPFALYYSPFYEISLRSGFWHAFLHLHFLIIGCLLMWPLMGIDPVPGRISYPLRLLMLFLMLPFHAFLGISIMSSTTLIAESWYLAFNRTWPPSPLDDQYLAGGIMWGSGDAIALLMLMALFVQWYAHSQREARREDRRLDRLEARLQRAATDACRLPRSRGTGTLRSGPDRPGGRG